MINGQTLRRVPSASGRDAIRQISRQLRLSRQRRAAIIAQSGQMLRALVARA